jgi:dynein intermediate chain 1, axonemal
LYAERHTALIPSKKRDDANCASTWAEPVTTIVRPLNQLLLDQKELDAEHTRILSGKDPTAPQNIVRFSFKDKVYKLEASVEQCKLHFEREGNLMHRESEEGKRIFAEMDAIRIAAERAAELEQISAATITVGDQLDSAGIQKLRNQFNYSERASQTVS